MAEIFVSYTSSDREWAQWIATELRALGHAPHVHEWEIGKGEDILGWMERHHGAADHVLCVVSAAYLDAEAAPWSALERRGAIWHALQHRRPDFVLFVVVHPCALPSLLGHLRRCEVFNLPEAAARTRFHAFMTAPAAPAAVPFPDHPTAESNITIRVPLHFMGRDDAMAEIEATLRRFRGRAAITALRGMRGVGKTVLAAAYAEKHRQDYRATWWLRAETPDTLRADLVALGQRLGWVADGEAQDAAVARVIDRLAREGEGILLIFDNAPDADAITPFLPRGGAAHVLITSNAHAWSGVADAVEIRLWPRAIGAAYLLARSRPHSPPPLEGLGREADQGTGEGLQAAAEALSDALDGLPLAHDMAASYCEELGLTLAAYHARFAAEPAEVLDDADSAPAAFHDRLTVAKAFTLAIEAAAQRHPAAEPLLVAAAMLPPEPIPLFLFSEGRAPLAEGLDTKLQGRGLERAVAALRRFALVEQETIPDERDSSVTTDTIRLHRLIRMVALWRRKGAAADAIGHGLLGALMAVYPNAPSNRPEQWPRCRRLDALATGLFGEDGTGAASTDLRVALLLIRVAQFRQNALAAYYAARPLFERALAIYEAALGPDHPHTAAAVANLAVLLQAQGDLAAARPLFERALAICEKALGAEHPDTATSLDNLASLLQAQGDLAAARPLFERALAICEKALGAEHPDTATSLDNLARLLQAQGDLAAARPLFERALAIREKALGAEHPDTATSLNNLARLLQAQGDLAAVRPLFERALAIYEKALGAEHPHTATSLNNLARLLQAQGDLAAARPLFERALAIHEKALGAEHPDTATSLNSLAGLLQAQGDLAAARPLFERALAIREKALGAEHPDTATSLNNLALLLQAQGDLAAVRPLFERALAICEKALGTEHPHTATSLNNLARLLQAQGDLAAARPLFERALAIYEKALGAEHPHTAASLNNLARLLQAQGDLAAARPLFERALAICEKALGAGHPGTAVVLRNLASVRRAQGEVAGALALGERVLRIMDAAFGAGDARAAHARNDLALTLLMLRRTAEADALLAETWRTLTRPIAIVTPAAAFLALLSAVLQGRPPGDPLGRLKTLLHGPALPRAEGVPHTWDIATLLPGLCQDLPEPWRDLAQALLAAINDAAQTAALEQYALWRDTPAVPLDAPWPDGP